MGRESKYLLSGLVRCGVCGGSMTANVQHSGTRNRRRLVVFMCGYRNNRGKIACSNSLRLPEPAVNEHVLEAMTSVMRPDILRAAVRGALDSLVEALGACENALREARGDAEAETESWTLTTSA